ncbi:MAG: hypothetical protein AAGF67_07760 [Verrucomicrobiota bacterium]
MERGGEATIENSEVASSEEKKGPRGDFHDPRLWVLLPELHKRSESVELSQRHLGWSIFELDELVYGRGADQPVQEFAAVGFEPLPDGMALQGAAVVLLEDGTFIESSVNGGITVREDGTYSTEGPSILVVPIKDLP